MAGVSKIFSAELEGLEAKLIEVETDINVGLHNFTIVGLADKALSEAKERVNSALKNIGVKPPSKENRRIVVNLAPADVKKTGSQYDLAIAVGYLLASGQIREFDARNALFLGELSLEGKVRPVTGALGIARLAARRHLERLFVPEANAEEAAIVEGVSVVPVSDLRRLIAHLEGTDAILPKTPTVIAGPAGSPFVDIGEIKGQEAAKRALTVAAAGGHNLLMVGPPGTGKTMLAQALISILPPPSPEEAIEITEVYSAAGLLGGRAFIHHRPFRSPHQTASPAAVVGGGQFPKPGEISLAHRGILFLDELPEFRRDILESLRQPLESGQTFVSRIKGNLVFPARFTLVAAMNPCPCGYYGDPERECRCGAYEVIRYQKKISGPLLDRIDIQINVPRVRIEKLRGAGGAAEESVAIREAVARAREVERKRFAAAKGKFTNAEMSSKECDRMIRLDEGANQFFGEAFDKSLTSARGYYRILKVAQTIADVEGTPIVSRSHVAEAFSYRLRTKE